MDSLESEDVCTQMTPETNEDMAGTAPTDPMVPTTITIAQHEFIVSTLQKLNDANERTMDHLKQTIQDLKQTIQDLKQTIEDLKLTIDDLKICHNNEVMLLREQIKPKRKRKSTPNTDSTKATAGSSKGSQIRDGNSSNTAPMPIPWVIRGTQTGCANTSSSPSMDPFNAISNLSDFDFEKYLGS